MKAIESAVEKILSANIETKQVNTSVQRTEKTMQEALRKINVFQEFMEDEDFGDSLDKIKNKAEKMKRDQVSASMEIVENTKALIKIKKKVEELENN